MAQFQQAHPHSSWQMVVLSCLRSHYLVMPSFFGCPAWPYLWLSCLAFSLVALSGTLFGYPVLPSLWLPCLAFSLGAFLCLFLCCLVLPFLWFLYCFCSCLALFYPFLCCLVLPPLLLPCLALSLVFWSCFLFL